MKKEVAAFTPEQQAALKKAIAALSAEARLKSQQELDEKELADITARMRKVLGLG